MHAALLSPLASSRATAPRRARRSAPPRRIAVRCVCSRARAWRAARRQLSARPGAWASCTTRTCSTRRARTSGCMRSTRTRHSCRRSWLARALLNESLHPNASDHISYLRLFLNARARILVLIRTDGYPTQYSQNYRVIKLQGFSLGILLCGCPAHSHCLSR